MNMFYFMLHFVICESLNETYLTNSVDVIICMLKREMNIW